MFAAASALAFQPQVLYSFQRGPRTPYAGLVLGSDGNFYGTTQQGGSSGAGTVFQITTNGVLTTLVSFNYANGASPLAGLVLGNDGNFYGTTDSGGSSDAGTVFQMTPQGVLTTLVSFSSPVYDGSGASTNANGANPQAGLTLGSDGNFYGTTANDGPGGGGTIFRLIISAFTRWQSNQEAACCSPAPGQRIKGIVFGRGQSLLAILVLDAPDEQFIRRQWKLLL